MGKNKKKELVIIGAGPAGVSASIYASRYQVDHLVIGKEIGGQISSAHKIDNYPGIENISGIEFSQKLLNHAKKYNSNFFNEEVRKIEKANKGFLIFLENGEKIETKTVLLATGTQKRKLNVLGEKKLTGKGVSYCATCDGFFFKDKRVAVIGGSDSAVGAAVYLSDIAKKTYLIYRGEKLRAEPFWSDLAKKSSNLETIYQTNILEIKGEKKVEKIVLDKKFQGKRRLEVDGIFIEVGSLPKVDFAKLLKLETNKDGYIKVNRAQETSLDGVWAAGDITTGSNKFRQVVTAVSEGAIAAQSIFKFLKK